MIKGNAVMKTVFKTLLPMLLLLVSVNASAGEPIRFVTWNIENLWHEKGIPLRPGNERYNPSTIREKKDYDKIRSIFTKLNADVVAVQEIGSPKALEKVMPAKGYSYLFSTRYHDDLADDPKDKRKDIYTGLVFRDDRVKVIKTEMINDLIIRKGRERTGVAAFIEIEDQKMWVVSLHIKSKCFKYFKRPPRGFKGPWAPNDYNTMSRTDTHPDCYIKVQQMQILEDWVENKIALGEEIVLLGDFNRRLADSNDAITPEFNDGTPATLSMYPKENQHKLRCSYYDKNKRPSPSIDYIFLTPALTKNVVNDKAYKYDIVASKVSDHCPVYLDLMIE